MRDRGFPGSPGGIAPRRIGVVDLGSNSLRLVVFDRLARHVGADVEREGQCPLGRGLARTGRLNEEGIELALANLQRFAGLARALGSRSARDAGHRGHARGPRRRDFAAEVERRCRVPVRISGARRRGCRPPGCCPGSAAPTARRRSRRRQPRAGSHRCGRRDAHRRGVTLPLGPLRLAESGDEASAPDFDRAQDREGAVAGRGSGQRRVSRRRRVARAGAAAHGAYALSAAHHPRIRRAAAGGGSFCDIVAGIAPLAGAHHSDRRSASRSCRSRP